MSITREDMDYIKSELNEHFVSTRTCNEIQANVNKKLASDDKRIELLIQQMKINNGLTLAIASGILTLVIKTFF